MIDIEPSWDKVLEAEFSKPYFIKLTDFVREERKGAHLIYPPKGLVFNALKMTPFDRVKAVIVGQDPYHGPGQAHGLSFSVPRGVALPPSLKNIFKELVQDLQVPFPQHGCLEKWAKEGVLLLNTLLTVRDGEPLSHKNQGWELFTDAIIKALGARKDPVIFLLWGKNAIEKCTHICHVDPQYILTAAHPSPFSAMRGFFGCRHFSKVNTILKKLGKIPIDWKLDE